MSILAKLITVAMAALIGGGSFVVYKIRHVTPSADQVIAEAPSYVVTTTTTNAVPGTTLK